MNFNCDVPLWENSRAAHRKSRARFEIGKHGSVWKRGGIPERVAQFESAALAERVLAEAGYTKTDKGVWKP